MAMPWMGDSPIARVLFCFVLLTCATLGRKGGYLMVVGSSSHSAPARPELSVALNPRLMSTKVQAQPVWGL
jgi:hypothetical protein